MNLRFLGLATLSLCGGLLVVGCAVEDADPSEAASNDLAADAATPTVDGGVIVVGDGGETCSDPNRFIVALKTGTCTVVQANQGKWLPSKLFASAPPEFKACNYNWAPSTPGVGADFAALSTFVGPGKISSACPGNVVKAAPMSVTGIADPGATPPDPGGTVGCDVCGFTDGEEAWVVIPQDPGIVGAFSVALTSGASVSFKVSVAPGIHAASVQLPAPPAGADWVPGPITVH